MGGQERDRLLRARIAAMDPDDFEQLVFELAQREVSGVRRLKAPDGGADTLRPARDGIAAQVWQAKHYVSNISWSKCSASLTAAIKRWEPSTIVFAFPRDLTEGQEKLFASKLKQHPDAVSAGVDIPEPWNLSELIRRLNKEDDLRERFFGPEQATVLAVLDRTAKAGGVLTDAKSLVERAKTLSDWAERQDTRFMQEVRSSGLEVPAPKWDALPHMILQVADATTRVSIAAWPREGAEIAPSVFRFYDNESGEQARMRAVRALARGEIAEVAEGAHVQFDAPELVKQLAPDEQLGEPVFTISPGEPVQLGIEVADERGAQVTRDVELYNVPPPPSSHGALAGYAGGVLVQINIHLLEEPRVRLEVNLTGSFTDDIRANADAAELLLAFHTAADATFRNALLFPDGVLRGRLGQPDARRVSELRSQEALFAALVLIEDRLGVAIKPPAKVTPTDIESLASIRRLVETGEGSAELNELRATGVDPAGIGFVAAELSDTVQQKDVTYDLFGAQLNLGAGLFTLPKLKVVDVKPHDPTSPASPADVVLRAEETTTMTFRLV